MFWYEKVKTIKCVHHHYLDNFINVKGIYIIIRAFISGT